MPGYAAHEVGSGFIDQRGVLDRLAALTGLEAVRFFGASTPIPDQAVRELASRHLFDPEGLAHLAAVVSTTGPVFAYDYVGQRVSARPLHPDDLRSLPVFERTLGVPAAPLESA